MIKIHLKEILKDKGITSKDFAVKMGVSAAAISNIITFQFHKGTIRTERTYRANAEKAISIP